MLSETQRVVLSDALVLYPKGFLRDGGVFDAHMSPLGNIWNGEGMCLWYMYLTAVFCKNGYAKINFTFSLAYY